MDVAIVIPARFASSRLPGKPLLRETGKYLIQHVYERAREAKHATDVIVATDDERIFDAVRSFGGRVVMTRIDHQSGTDRIAEVAAHLHHEVVVNLQGDEPQIDPAALNAVADVLMKNNHAAMATLAVPIRDRESYLNPNVVKVVCDDAGRAMFFSRSPIPMVRDGVLDFNRLAVPILQHVGVYAYRRDFLLRLAAAPPHPIELAEKLEQLRVLAMGESILVSTISHSHRGVDTPADYAAFVQSCQVDENRRAA